MANKLFITNEMILHEQIDKHSFLTAQEEPFHANIREPLLEK